MAESILINPVAPNEGGGLDLDYLGQFYAKGASYYNKSGLLDAWDTRKAISCGGDQHDSPYSYNLPKGAPVSRPLCVPANPPTMIAEAIVGLKARGIRTGISILGGGGGDNIPGIPQRSQLRALTQLSETPFLSFLTQLRAAATVLHDWGITHFDIDFEGGVASDLNAERLPQIFDALRFSDSIVSLTTESYSLYSLSSVLNSTSRPDMIQLMMGDYSETLEDGVKIAQGVQNRTGYPLSQFRFGVKPQCGVSVGTSSYLTGALPALVESGAGVMLWNLGRDYSCIAKKDSCEYGCAANSIAGQSTFSNSAPFAFTCAVSDAFKAVGKVSAASVVV